MGMFDWINVKINCPNCDKPLGGFQSKDSNCALDLIDPDYVVNFYTTCNHCKKWVEFIRPNFPEVHKPRDTPFSLKEIKELGFVLAKESRYRLP